MFARIFLSFSILILHSFFTTALAQSIDCSKNDLNGDSMAIGNFEMSLSNDLVLDECSLKQIHQKGTCYKAIYLNTPKGDFYMCRMVAVKSREEVPKITVKSKEWKSIDPVLTRAWYKGSKGSVYQHRLGDGGYQIEFVRKGSPEPGKKIEESLFLVCPADTTPIDIGEEETRYPQDAVKAAKFCDQVKGEMTSEGICKKIVPTCDLIVNSLKDNGVVLTKVAPEKPATTSSGAPKKKEAVGKP